MKVLYTKSVLYTYPVIDALIEQIDDVVLRRALYSMHDVSPVDEQCEKIISLTEQKKTLLKIHLACEKVLSTLTQREKDHLDYKYFKKKPKEYYENFDFLSRGYFRRQQVLCDKISRRLETIGIDDNWFQKNCLSINFFRELLRRVKERETLANKNKPKTVKRSHIPGYMQKVKDLSGVEPERQKDITKALA